ncbi:cell division topological specificity factor MinE [Clostridium sp. D2Q-11]|uniref:Cell division topological specificity factor n=1 Tax=Anaeromonas frigoriresistens TaxID=2683708 RepID=A0A942Z640_9FIRM|nr:cell division topological specificity factor MinE [Anaeromonas frigoriresistens]MBS4537172.1 cell division topological specificity factor MinE [Anaeromonas frigoriresistens]
MDLFKIFNKSDNKSKSVAKERLKLVLIHDRTNVSPKFLEMVKGDIINVISDYMEIDEEGLDIQFTRTRRESDNTPIPALVANIPILKMKDKGMK